MGALVVGAVSAAAGLSRRYAGAHASQAQADRANNGFGTVFGDGLRCVQGTVIRLGTKVNAAGGSSYPVSGDQSISVRGAITQSGSGRYYQVWYRNAAAFCTASTFNLTNGVQVTWTP
jgi:hypothetical protein